MLLRIRSNVGVWRITVDTETATLETVEATVAQTRPHVVYTAPWSLDPACPTNDSTSAVGDSSSSTSSTAMSLDRSRPLSQQGVSHGTMLHCRVDPSTTVDAAAGGSADATATNTDNPSSSTSNNMKRIIAKDGTIKFVPSQEATSASDDRGFRKGMLPLRDMKMHWTLTDFVAMDAQYEFKIKRQETAVCRQVSLDVPSITDFQSHLQRFAFARKRFAFLYGKFVTADGEATTDTTATDPQNGTSDKDAPSVPMKCVVEAIYEPPQEIDAEAAEGFVALDDDQEDTVDQIASMLGLRKVGWIFGHEARTGYTLSAAEVLMAAEFQLEAADGVHETPFCTVTVSPSSNGAVSVEAFQVSMQCMSMVAEEALEVDGTDPKVCAVNETFTAIQEGKESKTVENSFFLTVVPIVQHTSEVFIAEFPRPNRELDDRTPSHDELSRHLKKSGTAGWTFEDRLADFNLLVYLAKFLDVNADFPKICASIVDRAVPLDDGYKLILKSMAGMEGSY